MKNKQIEEFIKHYEELKRNKHILANIDKDFFFTFADETIEYIKQLENKVKELGKGQHALIQSRRKWKKRYYKEREKKDKTIYDAINFIQDNCLEEIADMKGCYREIASIGDLQELMDILRGEKEK